MDLPLMIPRFMVRKMISDAYKAGQLDQAREDARAVTDALKEVSNPQGLLLRQQDIAARPARIRPDRQKRDDDLVTHIMPDPLPSDDCGDLVRLR